MRNRRSQAGVASVAQGDLDGFIVFADGVVHHGNREGFRGFTGGERQAARCQGVVVPGPGGGAAGGVVIHGDGLTGDRRQGHQQVHRGHHLQVGGSGGVEGYRGLIVVVQNGVGVNRGSAQAAVGGAAQGDLDRLVPFVQTVVGDRNRYVLRGIAGSEGQGSRGQGVVGPGAGGRAAGDGVVHRYGEPGSRREGHRYLGRGCVFAAA